MKRLFELLKFPLIVLSVFIIIIYSVIKLENAKFGKCEVKVVTINGETFNCADATSYDNGTTKIILCDKKIIKIPTVHIKQIEYN